MDFGSFSRILFTRPLLVNTETEFVTTNSLLTDNTKSKELIILEDEIEIEGNYESKIISRKKNEKGAKISYRICVFPGQANIPKFKEILKYQTFSLQIYYEDLQKRAFNSQNTEEYRNLVLLEKNTNFVILKSDIFLIKCVEKALLESSRSMVRPLLSPNCLSFVFIIYHTYFPIVIFILTFLFLFHCPLISPSLPFFPTSIAMNQAHGSVRFRLEDILSTSADRLKEFEIRRKNLRKEHSTNQNEKNNDNIVFVKVRFLQCLKLIFYFHFYFRDYGSSFFSLWRPLVVFFENYYFSYLFDFHVSFSDQPLVRNPFIP